MTSVERIVDYGNLSPETDFHSYNDQVKCLAGSISFNNVWLRYAQEEAYVLKDLSFHIQEKEKVCFSCNWYWEIIMFIFIHLYERCDH